MAFARRRRNLWVQLLAGAALSLPAVSSGQATGPDRHVVIVSVDGFRPDLYLDPAGKGLELPHLTKMMEEGAYAEGVVSVFPSVTYPAHTSIVTGMQPRRHGILNNYVFDPEGRFIDWYWYAQDIRVTTLWEAASAFGGKTAALHWPVTVGASIDYNLPEYWVPEPGEADEERTWRDFRTDVVPLDFLGALEKDIGRLPNQEPEGEALDAFVFTAAASVFRQFRPALTLLHVFHTDEEQHDYGREHGAVRAAFESVDARIGALRATLEELGLHRSTLLIVTGDHGFFDVRSEIQINALFEKENLLEVRDDRVTDWKAMAWPSGGSCAIILKDRRDRRTRQKVVAVIDEALKDELLPAAVKVDREELDRRGTMEDAIFALEAKEGYFFGTRLRGSLLTGSDQRGHHGFRPELPKMKTGFIVVGPGVRAGTRIPEMMLVDIAPTAAAWAGWEFGDTDGEILEALFEPGALDP